MASAYGSVDETIDSDANLREPGVRDDVTLDSDVYSAEIVDDCQQRTERPKRGTRIKYFGDYEIIEEIARGGMGVVYKARQVKLDRIVALKMILGGKLADEAAVQRFYTEAQAAANLDHVGIVPIYEVGEHQGHHFFSMAVIEGQSLADRLRDGPLPPKEAARLIQQAAEAVAYAHEKSVIHRDIKPANILLESQDQKQLSGSSTLGLRLNDLRPKLTDFGLAKRTSDDSGMTATGQILGTPSFMPPEQAAGKTDEIGPLADVYSLGATLYATLTGRPPFQGVSIIDTLHQLKEQEPLPPRQLNAGISRDLETICLKCLQKQPGRRYASAAELSAELGRFLRGEPIVARPIGATARAWRWCQRRPLVAGLILAVAASLIVGTVVSSLFAALASWRAEAAIVAREEAREEKDRADEQLERSEWLLYASRIAAAQREWEIGNHAAAWEQLDACRWDFRGWEYDFVYNQFTKTKWFDLDRNDIGIKAVAYDLERRRLATAGSDDVASIWDMTSGQEVMTLAGHGSNVTALAYSDDGTQIAVGTQAGLVLWDADSGEELTRLNLKRWVLCLAFDARAERIVCASSGSLNSELKVWDTTSGQAVLDLGNIPGKARGVAFSPDGARIAYVCEHVTSGYEFRIWDATTGRQLNITEREHDGRRANVMSVAFSPDGRKIVSGGDSEDDEAAKRASLKVWDAASGQEVLELQGHSDTVLAVAFSPDGRRIASGSSDKTLRVWDAESGRELLRFEQDVGVASVVFTPDDTRIFSVGQADTRLRVWDAVTGDSVPTLKGYVDPITCVAFSPDGRQIVTGSKDSTLRLWDGDTGRLLRTMQADSGAIDSVAFSPDGRQVVGGVGEFIGEPTKVLVRSTQKIAIWDAETGQESFRVGGHNKNLAFSADGQRIAGGQGGRTIVDAENGKVLTSDHDGGFVRGLTYASNNLRILREVREQTDDAGGRGRISTLVVCTEDDQALSTLENPQDHFGAGVAFSLDGRRVATAGPEASGRTRTLRVWDVATGRSICSIETDREEGLGLVLALSPDGKRIVLAGRAGVWDAGTGQFLFDLEGNPFSVAFSRDGRRIVGGGGNRTLRVWDAASGDELMMSRSHRGSINGVAFSRDGRRVVSGSDDKTLKLWDAANGHEVLTLRGHEAPVQSVAFSQDGRRIVSGGADGTVKFWDALHSDPVRILTDPRNIEGVAFTPDGRRLIGAINGDYWKVWDLTSGREVMVITGYELGAWTLSPDGRRIAGRSSDSQNISVWDTSTGEQLLTFGRHEDRVLGLAFSRDGRRIVSGSQDKTLKVWDATSGDELLTLSGHTSPVENVAFSPDGKRIGSHSSDRTVRVWDAATGRQLHAIGHSNEIVGFGFSPDGKRIVTADRSQNPPFVKVWDADAGTMMLTLPVHQRNMVAKVAYSPDGQWIACGMDSLRSLHIWRASDGRQIVTLRPPYGRNEYAGALDQLAFSPDSKRIAAVAGYTVTIWDLSRFID